jgi:hypothetical protein
VSMRETWDSHLGGLSADETSVTGQQQKGLMEVVEPEWRRTAQGKGRCEAGEIQQGEKKCVTKFTSDVFLQHLLWRTRLGI